jgi:hypothetical protein
LFQQNKQSRNSKKIYNLEILSKLINLGIQVYDLTQSSTISYYSTQIEELQGLSFCHYEIDDEVQFNYSICCDSAGI